MEHIRVTPVRMIRYDDDLGANRSRCVGFRGVSTSGWQGPVRVIRQDAVRDVYEYRASLRVSASRGEDMAATRSAGASAGG